MSKIFLSYRRDDSPDAVDRLYERLISRFGEDSVFMDADTLEPGEVFAEVLEKTVGACDALVAVIGPRWLAAEDEQGQKRLEKENDWVRLEISTALTRRIRVVPALLENTSMPRRSELPGALADLADRQALRLTRAHFHQDTDLLVKTLEKVLAPGGEPASAQLKQDERRSADSEFSRPQGSTIVARSESGPAIVATEGSTVQVGLSERQFEDILRSKLEDLRKHIASQGNATDGAGERKLRELERRLQDIHKEYQELEERHSKTISVLEELREEIPSEQLADAKKSLASGDATGAKKVFESLLSSEARIAAEAAYQMGVLAGEDLDLEDAYEYVQRAAKLEPANVVYLVESGRQARQLDLLADSEQAFISALALTEGLDDPERVVHGIVLCDLAVVQRRMDKHVEAEARAKEALAFFEERGDSESEHFGRALHTLAVLYSAQNRQAEALPLNERASQILEQALGAENSFVQMAQASLAAAYNNLGMYDAAESLLDRIISTIESTVGPSSLALALPLTNLAYTLSHTERHEEALALGLRALRIYESNLGQNHSMVALALNNLSGTYQELGALIEAANALSRSTKIVQEVFGVDSLESARSANNCGKLSERTGLLDDAEFFYSLRTL